MHELHSSRREVMRALIIAPSIIATPVASAATGLVCTPTATQDPAWLALLEDERRLSVAFDIEANQNDKAYSSFFAARSDAEAALDQGAGEPWRFIQARPAHEVGEVRTTAGIRDYNAHCERIRAIRDGMDDRLRSEMDLDSVDDRYDAASDAHYAAVCALIAFPSRDPDIIAHKLRMIVSYHGDANGDLTPLLTSITGEA